MRFAVPGMLTIRGWSMLFAVSVLFAGCAGTSGGGGYSQVVDVHLVYEPGQVLRQELLSGFDRAGEGVELRIHTSDLATVHRELRKWIQAVQETGGTIRDRDKVLYGHALLGGSDDGALKGLVEKLADKAEQYFDAVNRNRRLFYARKHNLAVREQDSMLFLWFVNRRHKI